MEFNSNADVNFYLRDTNDELTIKILKFNSSYSSKKTRVERITFFCTYDKIVVHCYRDINFCDSVIREQRPVSDIGCVGALKPKKLSKKTIKKAISHWDLSDYWRGRLINKVLTTTENMLGSVSPGENAFDVFVGVTSLTRQYIEATERNIVRATNLSIPPLEKKILTSRDIDGANCESCRVCLEDFFVGCKAVCMPCSHVFHGDCIKEWLRDNRCCPLCRFEVAS